MDRLFRVVVRIKGARAAAKEPEERISPVLSIPADYKQNGFSDCLLLFAAETTGPWWYRPPPGLFSFASICLYLVSVSSHHEDAASPKTLQGRECRARFVGYRSRFE